MASVLAIAPGTPVALEGRSVAGAGIEMEVVGSPAEAWQRAQQRVYDLLVLSGLTVDQQNDVSVRFQHDRRWRLVPVLFVLPEGGKGISVPGRYRPDLDGLVRGDLFSPAVGRRIQLMAHDGAGAIELVIAGGFELDPLRLKLSLHGVEVGVTEREAEVLSILLSRPNRTVSASEIIQRGWGVGADERYLQILRRHVSNIRRKLDGTPGASSVRTVRGSGYRFDTRLAS